jgi:hypothetical protein
VDARPEVAELTQRGGMERGGRHARLAERRQPRSHLAGGLVVNVTTRTSRGRITPVASA